MKHTYDDPFFMETPKYALYMHDPRRHTEVVRVVAIHHDTTQVYYTVRFDSGRERQTERKRLIFLT